MKLLRIVLPIMVLALLIIFSCNKVNQPESPMNTSFQLSASSVHIIALDSVQVTISNGIPPYSIIQNASSIAQVTLSESNLNVKGLSLGTTSVVVGDASSPQNIDTLQIFVETAISFSSQVYPIFGSYGCTGCHGQNGGLNLSNGVSAAYGNLVNVTAVMACTNLKRVKPADPANSVLYLRLTDSECGSQMPKGGGSISSNDLAKVTGWILQGAKQN